MSLKALMISQWGKSLVKGEERRLVLVKKLLSLTSKATLLYPAL